MARNNARSPACSQSGVPRGIVRSMITVVPLPPISYASRDLHERDRRPQMPIEIEKKYRLSRKQRDEVLLRLPKIGAKRQGQDFEENTLYTGNTLDVTSSVLRLRRIGNRGVLTYKQSLPPRMDMKHRREDETRVEDPESMELILEALGFTPALVYEKRRETWRLA